MDPDTGRDFVSPPLERTIGAGWKVEKAGAAVAAQGTMQVRTLAGVTVLEERLPLCEGRREGDPGTAENPARIAVVHIAEGCQWGASNGRSVLLKPGSLVVWHTSLPLAFRVVEALRKVTFLFTEASLAALLPRAPQACCAVVPWDGPLAPLVDGYFRALTQQLDALPRQYEESAMAMTREIVAKALMSEQAEVVNDRPELLWARIIEYIERSLQDPTLSPPVLAIAHGISLRYLHARFSRRGHQVAGWIRRRRLERCREAIGSAPRSATITSIAFQWGFNDSAHFSRLFTKEFGLSPNAYRRFYRANATDGTSFSLPVPDDLSR